MSKKLKTEAVDHLFECIYVCRTERNVIHFLRMCVRSMNCFLYHSDLKLAGMLRDQKTYLDIAEKTGASTATISRVNRSLNYGNDGYEMVFSRLSQKHPEQE